VQARIRPQGATLIVNGDAALALAVGAQGAHLSAERLMRLEALPAARPRWVAASCHDARELAQANRLGIDFVVAGPVFATESHPGAPTLGLDGLARLCAEARMPVYALGGLRPEDLPRVRAQGAQGIAAIRGLWGGAA
jgi:8-oxo-dGTP diphosphatase